jgi:hypothetical protein
VVHDAEQACALRNAAQAPIRFIDVSTPGFMRGFQKLGNRFTPFVTVESVSGHQRQMTVPRDPGAMIACFVTASNATIPPWERPSVRARLNGLMLNMYCRFAFDAQRIPVSTALTDGCPDRGAREKMFMITTSRSRDDHCILWSASSHGREPSTAVRIAGHFDFT